MAQSQLLLVIFATFCEGYKQVIGHFRTTTQWTGIKKHLTLGTRLLQFTKTSLWT